MIALIDVDGSISEWSRRAKEAGPEPDRLADPKGHTEWCKRVQNKKSLAEDLPIPLMVRTIQALGSVAKIIYLTARSEEFEQVTADWIKSKGFPPGTLICRSKKDKRPGWDYKGSVIQIIQEKYPKDKLITVDDDPGGDCSPVYRRLGVVHLKVMWCVFDAEGNKEKAYA